MTIRNEMTDELTTGELITAELIAVPDAGGAGDDDNNNNGDGTTKSLADNPMPGNVRAADIVGEMQTAYLDYAMSVIVARALPDVRDGLKPVHRRILYAMSHDLYLTHTKPHRKSARIVGEVLGKYHPHGDVAVYDAMVRMAQDFSLRYPLIDGQGNFGSIDGDGAAAMRYTEARLAEISELMLADLDKDTVEWHGNFDNSLEEPDVLPAALPNLLINGSSGIAVGMATNIPPHNLNEIVDALVYLIDRYDAVEEITVDELLQFVKGPDFPTGGILYRFREDKGDENIDVIAQGYAMGKARLIVQAKAHFEEMSRGRSRIVITELPYQTNKTALIERIASLVRDGKIEGITDLRDESDRTGMRIAIELTRNADSKNVLKDLFKYTPLQQTFGMQMLALVDGQPRLLSLKRALHLFVQHREEIIRRRSEYDLGKARDRAHIVEGLLKALDILDEVIATIRRSQTVETARNNLVKNFQFSVIQAQAILDMQLRRLAALERKKLKEEYDELLKRIAYLEDLLAHPEKILAVIREDLLAQKEKYGDARRTQIVDRIKGTLTTTDLLPQQEVWVTLNAEGELRRQDVSKPSVAIIRQLAKHGQVAMLTANTLDWLYVFCRDGRCARIAVHEIPQNGSPKHVAELCEFTRRDMITAAISIPRINATEADGYLFLATALGDVKRVTVADFVSNVAAEFTAIAVDTKDRLGWVFQTTGEQEIMLITATGQSIRFAEDDARSMGLAAGGVGGIKLKKSDIVIHADRIDPAIDGTVVTMTAKGYAKRSALSEYGRQGRNGGGIVTHKPTSRTGLVTAAMILDAAVGDEELIATITAKKKVEPLTIGLIPLMGRGVQGKQVIELSTGDEVSALKRIIESTTPAPTERPSDPVPDAGDGSAGTTATSAANGSNAKSNGSVSAGTNGKAPTARMKTVGSKERVKTAKPSTAGPSTSTQTRGKATTSARSRGKALASAATGKGSTAKQATTQKADEKAPAVSTTKPPTKSVAKSKATQSSSTKSGETKKDTTAPVGQSRRKPTRQATRQVEAAIPLRDAQAKEGATTAEAKGRKRSTTKAASMPKTDGTSTQAKSQPVKSTKKIVKEKSGTTVAGKKHVAGESTAKRSSRAASSTAAHRQQPTSTKTKQAGATVATTKAQTAKGTQKRTEPANLTTKDAKHRQPAARGKSRATDGEEAATKQTKQTTQQRSSSSSTPPARRGNKSSKASTANVASARPSSTNTRSGKATNSSTVSTKAGDDKVKRVTTKSSKPAGSAKPTKSAQSSNSMKTPATVTEAKGKNQRAGQREKGQSKTGKATATSTQAAKGGKPSTKQRKLQSAVSVSGAKKRK